MRKVMKRVGALMASVVIALSSSIVAAAEEGYTYNYDYWGDVQYGPDAYAVSGVYTSVELGLDKKLTLAESLYVHENMLYICDTGNNRIIEMERTEHDKFEVKRYIESFKGNEEVNTLSGPTDISISEDGHMFICDKGNERVIKLDMDLNFVTKFTKPGDATFDQSLSFQPHRLITDKAGRVYCIATNVNKGLIKFEPDGEFSGFIGATPVSYSVVDYLKKKFATAAQRAKMEAFVPTEYSNLYVDDSGFIYTTAFNIAAEDIRTGKINPVRRLNLLGNDILIRNGENRIIGDLYFDKGGGFDGPSRFTDITTFDNDVYTCVDKTRGRLFTYNDQGRLLWAFGGGGGNAEGYFKLPVSVEHMGYDLIVLDQQDASITVFTPTEFGALVFAAMDQFTAGEYEKSAESWQKVIDINGNYDLAYIGIGRTLLRQEKYKEALEYFELKYDRSNYSRAFKEYRQEWIEDNIVLIIVVVLLVLCVPLAIGRIKKIKWQIDTADIFRV